MWVHEANSASLAGGSLSSPSHETSLHCLREGDAAALTALALHCYDGGREGIREQLQPLQCPKGGG
jgi:hypothetical protein